MNVACAKACDFHDPIMIPELDGKRKPTGRIVRKDGMNNCGTCSQWIWDKSKCKIAEKVAKQS